jgi:preprotein translocase subunit SecA
MSEDFGLTLMSLTFFASPQLAQDYLAETKATSLDGLAMAMRRVFRSSMRQYAWLSRTIQHLRAEQEQAERQPVVRAQPKVGRNEPCPCGSGRKFKKCCGANVH